MCMCVNIRGWEWMREKKKQYEQRGQMSERERETKKDMRHVFHSVVYYRTDFYFFEKKNLQNPIWMQFFSKRMVWSLVFVFSRCMSFSSLINFSRLYTYTRTQMQTRAQTKKEVRLWCYLLIFNSIVMFLFFLTLGYDACLCLWQWTCVCVCACEKS